MTFFYHARFLAQYLGVSAMMATKWPVFGQEDFVQTVPTPTRGRVTPDENRPYPQTRTGQISSSGRKLDKNHRDSLSGPLNRGAIHPDQLPNDPAIHPGAGESPVIWSDDLTERGQLFCLNPNPCGNHARETARTDFARRETSRTASRASTAPR